MASRDPGLWLQSFSPQAPDDLVGEYRSFTPEDVAATVVAARGAQREWWSIGAAKRAAALEAAASELRGRRDEAVALIVREVGKPIGEAGGEVARAISILEYYAQASFAALGELYPPSLSGLLYTERRPHGVAGLITPWNFPLAIPLWKAAPALASGNAVVLKPSPDAAGCGALLAEILQPHLPEGLLTVTQGGAATGKAVVDQVDAVSFTGSVKVGRGIAAAAALRGILAQCEMGGQNAAIVLEDADVEATANLIAGAAMAYAGQKCTATRRVIVVGRNGDFVGALAAAVTGLTPADPFAPATVVGPVINQRAVAAVQSAVETAREDGGRILSGGEPLSSEGWYVRPALVDGLDPGHMLNQEETFGPFAVVQRADNLGHAIALANGVRFGLVTSVHGRDLDHILSAIGGLDTGMIKVNAATTGVDFYAPFGGEKLSSYGPREQGMAALAFYGTTRTITVVPHRP